MSGEEPVPLIIRVAGLPAQSMESFHSDSCTALLREGLSLGERLASARAEVADRIFEAMLGASPEVRRVLLDIKRACFNGRSLLRHRSSPHWPALPGAVGEPASRVVALEEAQARNEEAYRAAYEEAASSERDAVRALSTDRGLIRGVTLASPALIEGLPRFDRGVRDKRQARLEASLLRYASRAALKTSPFSTLTRTGLGVVTPAARGPLQLVGAPLQERSLLRFKRYLLDQDHARLLQIPAFASRLRVALNSSRWEPSPGRHCFIRPAFWAPKKGEAVMAYTAASVVQLDLSGPLIAWLVRELPGREPPLAELLETLARTFNAAEGDRRIRDTLTKLLQIGFLRLLPPWSSNEGHLERRMLASVRACGDDPTLVAFGDALEQIVTLQDGFAEAERPLESLRELGRLVDTLWQTTQESWARAPGEPAAARHKFETGALYEDVFLEGTDAADPWRAIVAISPEAAESIVESTRPLAQLAQIASHRHELLHAVAAFAEGKWPGEATVGIVEVMREVQPLFRAYTAFLAETEQLAGASRRAALFNPFGLAAVDALRGLRGEIWAEIERGAASVDGEVHLSCAALSAAFARVPRRYQPTLEACLLVQPADSTSSRWVLNQLFEGTGRYGSRYTAVMSPDLRERYAAHFAERGTIEGADGSAELLDLVYSFGETLNLHAAQTPSVLEMLDESLDAPASRKLTIRELFVRFGGADEIPRVVDASGRIYAPVHLGVADQTFMPFIVRLLSLFGPGELRLPPLPRAPVTRGQITIWPRVILGQVVALRRRWTFPVSALPAEVLRAPAREEAFAALNRWRMAEAIPERVFVTERVRGALTKPQYIDFTSPLFVQIFLTIVGKDPSVGVDLEEMLPTPDAAPADAEGRRWVVELQLDTLARRAGRAGERELTPRGDHV